jgi:hypothetical protein
MRTVASLFARSPFARQPARRAFSLPEMINALAVFFLVIGGVIASHLYGLRVLQVVNPKLGASDEARDAVSLLLNNIRSAKLIRIGNGNLTSFAEVGVNTAQKGSAIQVYPTMDTNLFIRYFWDATDQKLKVTTNGSSAVHVVANSVSNSMVFTAEDHLGNVLTNNYNNRLIGLRLEFYQIEYPKMPVGRGEYFDYYRLSTRIARRTIL